MEPLSPDEPRVIGPYRLVGRLGAGGMGRVYLGRSSGGRTVAVKAVHPYVAHDPSFRARFRREIEAARRVGGRWTAPVLDADPEAAVPWVATGFFAGPPLSAAVDEHGPLSGRAVRGLGAGLAEALAAVHGLGLVHRDVKPSNVLLTLDGPRLIDFGIARAVDGTSALTSTGVTVGSPGFMPPEAILGKDVTGAADVFSLGAVLAFAASGHTPFRGGTTATLLYKVVHEEPELGPMDDELRELVFRCLEKEPAARPEPGEILTLLAPDGPSALIGPGWLPGALVEQVSRTAVGLLDLEAGDGPAAVREPGPGEGEAASGLVPFTEFSAEPISGPGPEGAAGPVARPGSGGFGPPTPPVPPTAAPDLPVPAPGTAVPEPRPAPDSGGSPPTPDPRAAYFRDEAPPRAPGPGPSVEASTDTVTATPAEPSPGPAVRRRRVTCSVTLTLALALLGALLGTGILEDMLPDRSGADKDMADSGTKPVPSASAPRSSSEPAPRELARVPGHYVDTWNGTIPPRTADSTARGTKLVADISPGKPGGKVGTTTETDPRGEIICEYALTLRSVTATRLVADAERERGDGCAAGVRRFTFRYTEGSDGEDRLHYSARSAAGWGTDEAVLTRPSAPGPGPAGTPPTLPDLAAPGPVRGGPGPLA
ncbi:serine/threonine-protein kinase [Streptomyces sp. NPDC006798]|uniref:serine/threonine-protein kinase n=1 Tax=Streptomyces sp. NPDC006798 TaxID=3155462 RepID=UPI0033DC91AE